MGPVGYVRIGSRSIDIQAFTGQVNGSTTSSTSHYHRFRVANCRVQHSIEVSERAISISKGQKVTGFWGVVRGHDSDWLALFNHDTGTWAWFRPARNKLAGPPMNQLLIAVAIVAGAIGVRALAGGAPTAFLLLGVSGLIFWRVQRRRRALMNAVTTALTAVRMEA